MYFTVRSMNAQKYRLQRYLSNYLTNHILIETSLSGRSRWHWQRQADM